jgi:hypothetical protein
MQVSIYADSDAVYVKFHDRRPTGGRNIDDVRHLDLGPDGETVAVQFLNVSEGIDLDDIPGVPQQEIDELTRELFNANIPIKSAA